MHYQCGYATPDAKNGVPTGHRSWGCASVRPKTAEVFAPTCTRHSQGAILPEFDQGDVALTACERLDGVWLTEGVALRAE